VLLPDILNHVVFAAGVLGLAVCLIIVFATAVFFRQFASDAFPPDGPPSMRGGGLVFVGAFLVGVVLVQMLGKYTPINAPQFWGFFASTVLISITSFYCDYKSFDAKLNLCGQIIAAGIAMYSGVIIDEIYLPLIGRVVGGWWVYPATLLWILVFTNVYRGLDKVDGLAVSGAVVVSAFFSFIAFQQRSVFIYLCSVSMFAASIGFLFFNWPPAKILMGNAGTTFLGFSFALMAIIAALYDNSHTSLLVVPLLIFHILFDASFYILTKSNVLRISERRGGVHLHDLLGKVGYSSHKIIFIHCAMAATQGLGAVFMININGDNRIWIFLPFLLFQLTYSYWLVNRARSLDQTGLRLSQSNAHDVP
jgi:UDP-N-acetylmuramyl pentapeptide phosphotransferase/UDP-N-acetylglucosamine-1-phosphate transferase